MSESTGMSESTDMSSDKVSSEFFEALGKAGFMPVDTAAAICQLIGKELQGVPSQYRRLAIARLRNKATLFEAQGFDFNAGRLIEALCSSWETFD